MLAVPANWVFVHHRERREHREMKRTCIKKRLTSVTSVVSVVKFLQSWDLISLEVWEERKTFDLRSNRCFFAADG